MCGIALIISGICIDASSCRSEFNLDSKSPSSSAFESKEVHEPVFSVDDLKVALLRRGPDHLGGKKILVELNRLNSTEIDESQVKDTSSESVVVRDSNNERTENGISCLCYSIKRKDCISPAFEVVCTTDVHALVTKSVAELQFLGATLQLRGTSPVLQPLVDASGNLLVYNGEIFGGIDVGSDSNDGETLMHMLERCCSCDCLGHGKSCYCIDKGQTSVPMLLSAIRGPWALIYWQANSKTIWFGRDAFGRRSLLVHWPTLEDPRFLLSSVSPPSPLKKFYTTKASNCFGRHADFEVEDGIDAHDYWEELSCGIYSICFDAVDTDSIFSTNNLVGVVKKHGWTDPLLQELIKWERISAEPKSDEFHSQCLPTLKEQHVFHSLSSDGMPSKPCVLEDHVTKQERLHGGIPGSLRNGFTQSEALLTSRGAIQHSFSLPAHKVLFALRESVMRRTTLNKIYQGSLHETREEKPTPIALLFSGGLDSMILAALLDQCLNSVYDIDLLNVSFDGQLAPDRITARAGVVELKMVSPSRRWRLVEIDADMSRLASDTKHVTSLISPAKTYMDLNIGIALWLAAGGDGWVDEGICNHHERDQQRYKYKSNAKILLVGSGADEQCAGYGRHRTKYRLGGCHALEEEMKLDMQRIWKRNLGRDDRCISDNGKEARFPFLDEDVIRTLLEIPLQEVADLDQPVGRGDKKILREVAQLLGLREAAALPKRAIQFGSRIARESNRKNFGSNRAANQASAGSVVIHKPKC